VYGIASPQPATTRRWSPGLHTPRTTQCPSHPPADAASSRRAPRHATPASASQRAQPSRRTHARLGRASGIPKAVMRAAAFSERRSPPFEESLEAGAEPAPLALMQHGQRELWVVSVQDASPRRAGGWKIGVRTEYAPGVFCGVGLAMSDRSAAQRFCASLLGWRRRTSRRARAGTCEPGPRARRLRAP
jgi:hypothetical protein